MIGYGSASKFDGLYTLDGRVHNEKNENGGHTEVQRTIKPLGVVAPLAGTCKKGSVKSMKKSMSRAWTGTYLPAMTTLKLVWKQNK